MNFILFKIKEKSAKTNKTNSKTEVEYVMIPIFVQLLNQSIDEKFHSFQRVNQLKKPKEFVAISSSVTFSLELL